MSACKHLSTSLMQQLLEAEVRQLSLGALQQFSLDVAECERWEALKLSVFDVLREIRQGGGWVPDEDLRRATAFISKRPGTPRVKALYLVAKILTCVLTKERCQRQYYTCALGLTLVTTGFTGAIQDAPFNPCQACYGLITCGRAEGLLQVEFRSPGSPLQGNEGSRGRCLVSPGLWSYCLWGRADAHPEGLWTLVKAGLSPKAFGGC
ncbi:hypothetical protein L345_16465, partial [Ophiophagus hannah]